MKKYLVFVLAMFVFQMASSQKLYIWKPKDLNTIPRSEVLKSDTLVVSFFDGRIINDKSKVECSSDDLQYSILKELKETYPNTIVIRDNSIYHKKDHLDKKILKIGISAYQAGFGVEVNSGIGVFGGAISPIIVPQGKWNALTVLIVNANNLKESASKTISNSSSRNNTFGYKSSKSALDEAYTSSLQELFFFIDTSF